MKQQDSKRFGGSLVVAAAVLAASASGFLLGRHGPSSTIDAAEAADAAWDFRSHRSDLKDKARVESHANRPFVVSAELNKGPERGLAVVVEWREDLESTATSASTASTAVLMDDHGNVVVPERYTPKKIMRDRDRKRNIGFALPDLEDGYYRAEILTGWHGDDGRTSIASNMVFLEVRNGVVEQQEPDLWSRNSEALFATKRGI